MKLFEILEPIDVERESKDIQQLIGSVVDIVKAKKLGSGAYAVVYDNPDDPGTVTKVSKGISRTDLERGGDAYLGYITELAKYRELTGNPYLPRIYSIKFYEDQSEDTEPWKRIKYVVELEKLKPITDMKIEKRERESEKSEHSYTSQVVAMADRMFEGFEELYGRKPLGNVVNLIVLQLQFHLGIDKPSPYMKEEKQLRIKDENLEEAIDVLKKVKANSPKNTVFFDINAGNIMIRRTPYGLQMVLTDPVA